MTSVEKLFREVIPFWNSNLVGEEGDALKALRERYAYLDIEILRKVDPEVRELLQRQVAVRDALDSCRDRYYFIQGGNKTAEKMGLLIRNVQAILEILADEEDPPSV